ncbi:hypothetical protein OG272_02640 [Streptomyces sp. NBC_00104]|uniref:hypothetical protein n=1 Tax=unclassified Streptomyces TaxID=2593676 RepID=UPI003248FBA5
MSSSAISLGVSHPERINGATWCCNNLLGELPEVWKYEDIATLAPVPLSDTSPPFWISSSAALA